MPHPANHKKFPVNPPKRVIRHMVLAMAVIEPLMTIPQILEIWVKQQAAGVSSLTWGFYLLSAVIWTIYGLQIKDKPIIIASILWIVMESAVLVGTLIYS
jgi:uncharacterized protein with PQ loop repeat